MCIRDRYNSCNNTGKSAAMYSADTAADLVQEQLGKSKNQRDLLLVAVFQDVYKRQLQCGIPRKALPFVPPCMPQCQ